ncbi:hypothetical protein BJ508DRAFT_216419 [Ascobolus immersus RN42]|uniref:LysM domain-containing protein n=1 Tax=Ascobolus immersus RN42 TaxID=1160509 RepID=A0A3N4HTY7_ASCIM|nr:hypothetical protein BJ508DRAFT_216419 [Ascobolus immersus RN42]
MGPAPADAVPPSTKKAPAATQKGITSRCTRWHVAKSRDSCYWIAKNNGCSLGAFYAWNKALSDGGECAQLWVGYAYCVSTK